MSQTFNLGGLGDNKLTKLIFSNGTANTCSIFLDNNGYLVFEQGANTVTFPLGELPADKRLAIENGIVVEGKDIEKEGAIDNNQNNLVVDEITEDALVDAVADALGVENLFSTKSEPQAGQGTYPGFANAMYFDAGNYLENSPRVSDNSLLFSYSLWVKFETVLDGAFLTSSQNSWQSDCRISDGQIQFFDYGGGDQYGNGWNVESAAGLLRDTSAWYHLVFVGDKNATGGDKVRIYVNGKKLEGDQIGTSNVASRNPTHSKFNHSSYTQRIGVRNSSTVVFKGYMANIQMIDGQGLDASAFGQYLQVDGEETNIWIPKPLDPSISYGANGFYLDFSRNTVSGNDITIVHDVAPIDGTHTAANDWTAN